MTEKKDYLDFIKEGIIKPESNNNGKKVLDPRVLVVSNQYKHLFLNMLVLRKNGMKQEDQNVKLPVGKKNGKNEILETYGIEGICAEIISYPLFKILEYINEHFSELKGDNTKQIDVAKLFNIKNLGTFYRIIKGLDLIELVDWKSVDMPVEIFERLVENLKKDKNIPKKDLPSYYLELGIKIGINSPKVLHTGLSAIFKDDYSLPKIRISSSEESLYIKNHVERKGYIKGFEITEKDFDGIIDDLINYKVEGQKKPLLESKEKNHWLSYNREKKLRSILAFFGYEIKKKKIKDEIIQINC